MMAEIGCDVSIGAGRLVQERIPRSPAYGDRSDGPLGVARDSHTVAGSGQRGRHLLSELLKGDRLDEFAQPSGAHIRSLALLPHQGPHHHEAECPGKGIGHSGIRVIGVRMGREQCDAIGDKSVDETALGIGRSDGVHPAQEKRMVRHDELGADLNRLVDHRHHRIDREQHPLDRVLRVAARETDRIPVCGEARRVYRVEGIDEITNAQVCHAREGTRCRLPLAAQEVSDSVAAAMSARATPINWTALSRSLSSTQARVTVATG